jgi:hypothetical protein
LGTKKYPWFGENLAMWIVAVKINGDVPTPNQAGRRRCAIRSGGLASASCRRRAGSADTRTDSRGTI